MLLIEPLQIGEFLLSYFLVFFYSKLLSFAVKLGYLPNLILLWVYAGGNIRDARDPNSRNLNPPTGNSLFV